MKAIEREEQVKAGNRGKQLKLIVSMNPEWRVLFTVLAG